MPEAPSGRGIQEYRGGQVGRTSGIYLLARTRPRRAGGTWNRYADMPGIYCWQRRRGAEPPSSPIVVALVGILG